MKYYPQEFLNRLYKVRLRTTYVKITLLTFKSSESIIGEQVIKQIQGKVTSGSISVNGSSAIRRTVSLTMVVDENNSNITNVDNDISINKKFQLEIGLKNPFSDEIEKYGDIIWFQQGVFVISSVNSSRSTSAWTLNITAKDKMCLLDGTAGGSFYAPTVLSDKYIYLPDGDVEIEYPILRQIIYEAVNHYGGEDPSNIFINDLDDSARMLVKYDGYQPIYYVENPETKEGTYSFSQIEGSKQVNYGEDVGYKLTDFTYPGELTMSPGETVVNLLDKMVELLGNFEYFYDVEGHFIFQEIKNYVNRQSPLENLTQNNQDDEGYLPNFPASCYTRVYSTDQSVISLTDLDAAAAISHNPKYDNIKNDFVVWGERGENQPIHYHLTIDAKPAPYYTERWMLPQYDLDWNIIGYDTADTDPKLLNKYVKLEAGDNYWTGYVDRGGIVTKTIEKTGIYKIRNVSSATNYFIVVEGEKDPSARILISNPNVRDVEILSPLDQYEWREELYREALYLQTTVGFGNEKNVYYEELIGFWRDLYDPNNSNWDDTNHWNPNVYNDPTQLSFWLDTIDTGADIGKYSISQIGRRTKAVNNDKIKTIYNKEVPDLFFIPAEQSEQSEAEQELMKNKEYEYCLLPKSKWDLFSISYTGSSCFDEIRNLLYQHLNYNATISITCIPIYYLEPNTILYIEDAKSGIIGNYQITQFSLPLTYNGTMNISATEVVQRI